MLKMQVLNSFYPKLNMLGSQIWFLEKPNIDGMVNYGLH